MENKKQNIYYIIVCFGVVLFLAFVGYFAILFLYHILQTYSPYSQTTKISRVIETDSTLPEPFEMYQPTVTVPTRYAIRTSTGDCDYWYSYIDTLEATTGERKWLKDIIFCESTCRADAVSPAGATGLLQFMPRTWDWMGGGDIHDPYEQIDLALYMFRKGMASHWCCHNK